MIRKILLTTDGSSHSEKTVQQTIELAKITGAAVVVMHAFSPPAPLRKRSAFMFEELLEALEEEAKELAGAVAERLRAEGLSVAALVVEGSPVEAILRAADAEQPDLIAMGSHGHGGGMPGVLLGSVAERVVRHSAVSVWVVK